MKYGKLIKELSEKYSRYREGSISGRKIERRKFNSLIKKHKSSKIFKIKKLGESVEGRDIFSVEIGNGKTTILGWSQMHGDEPTSTKAIFDLLNFFEISDEFDDIRKKIFSKLSIHLIPVLNPDGAENFSRGNALDVDLNRDALQTKFPESKILKSLHKKIQPDWGFNLHDQNNYYSAGIDGNPSAISLLAPPFDFSKSVNKIRLDTMKLAASLHSELKKIIPGKIARYNDDFEPRAFGDNFIKWKTRSLLIESGTWKNDPDKEYLRMINFTSLLFCFLSIADKNYNNFTTENYLSIPENKEIIFDVLLKNLTIEKNKKRYKVDIGINRKETFDPGKHKFIYEGKIADLGDLSTFYGHKILNLRGMVAKPGKLYPKIFETITSLESINLNKLLHKGNTTVKVKRPVNDAKTVDFPINVTYSAKKKVEIKINENANLTIEKDNKIRYVIVNGFIYDAETGKNEVKNGFII